MDPQNEPNDDIFMASASSKDSLEKTLTEEPDDYSIAFIEKMTEYLKQDNLVYHLDMSGLQLMDVAKSKYFPINEQPPVSKIQASNNWFKVMDFF